jgi:hypothetical protein
MNEEANDGRSNHTAGGDRQGCKSTLNQDPAQKRCKALIYIAIFVRARVPIGADRDPDDGTIALVISMTSSRYRAGSHLRAEPQREERLRITGLKHLSDSTPARRIVDHNEPPRLA